VVFTSGLVAAALALGFAERKRATATLGVCAFLLGAATLWARPLWAPPLVLLVLSAALCLLMARGEVWEYTDAVEQSDTLTFLSGLVLNGGAFYVLYGARGQWSAKVICALLVLIALGLFVWRLKNPLSLWIATVALMYLAMGPFGKAVFALERRGLRLVLIAGVALLIGIAGGLQRTARFPALLWGFVALLSGLLAAAANPVGLLHEPVGWTVAVAIPLVYLGLGLALVQRLGPRPKQEEEER
jgi:uncharacterized membrane protein SirB2